MKISNESECLFVLDRIKEIMEMDVLKELDELYEALEDYEETRFKILPTFEQCETILSRVM